MSENEYQSRLQSLKPFITLFLVVMGSAFLASCGGGDSTTADPSVTAQSADGSIKTIQAVSGSATVPGTWAGRPLKINVTGAIAFSKENAVSTNGESPDSSTAQGIIINQFWVTSTKLSQSEIFAIISAKLALKPIAYRSEMYGYLIELDIKSRDAVSQLDILKTDKRLSIFNRSFTGGKVKKTLKIADDGSRFDDLGDNWHLEKIRISGAWDLTVGSYSQIIAVMDDGINADHEELVGRVADIYQAPLNDHGTAVSSVIIGNAGNGVGVSGINWRARLVFDTFKVDQIDSARAYRNLLIANPNVKVINSSWTETGKCGVGVGSCPSVNTARDKTRVYRNIASDLSGVMHVWAAGNDGKDAKYQNGALNYDDDGNLNRLDNVIIVGALLSSGELAVYSNYGESVDIVAPTEFKAASGYAKKGYFSNPLGVYGDNYSGDFSVHSGCSDDPIVTVTNCAFNGTSAASPVVAGVVSLIQDIAPQLTPAEIKKILILSATERVEKRNYRNFIEQIAAGEVLDKKIPILNAEAAVKMALDMKSQKNCGTISSPSIIGQQGPLSAVVGQLARFTATPKEKQGYPYGYFRWSTTEGGEGGGPTPELGHTFITPGTYSVTVTPELQDGTKCTLSAATSSVTVVAPSMHGILSDDFNSTTSIALDPAKWTSSPYKPGYGDPTVGGGLVHLANCQSANTAGKVTISGNRIVIKARFVGPKSWGRDTYISLIDSSTGSLLRIGDSNYWSGIYLQLSTSGSYEVVKSYSGTSTSQFQEYQITLEGKTVTIERGDTLATITKTITEIMPRSVTDGSYYVQIGTGGCDGYYSPADFDWIQVNGY